MPSNTNSKKKTPPAAPRGGGKGRRPIKVTPRRKTEIDPHMIALVYFLIASRIVREAEADEAGSMRPDSDEDVPDEAGLTGLEERS